MLNNDWRQLLAARFPSRDDLTAQREWASLKPRLLISQTVIGTVVAKAAFGAWLDIGCGFPALLLIPDVAGLTAKAYQDDDCCAADSPITAEVVLFNDSKYVVRVAQGTPHENRGAITSEGG